MSKKLAVVEQKEVTFYEDEITAVIVEVDGRRQIYVPIRPICAALGVDWSSQRQRINRDPILSELLQGVVVATTPYTGPGGGPKEMLCLPLEFLNGWLFGINATRVRDSVRPALLRYQRECCRVLYEATQEGRLSVEEDFETYLAQADPVVVDAYKVATAVVKIA